MKTNPTKPFGTSRLNVECWRLNVPSSRIAWRPALYATCFPGFLLSALCLLLFLRPASAATRFELQPGSVITLNGGSLEPLSGTFTWVEGPPIVVDGMELPRFDLTDLQLQSASVSLRSSALSNLLVVLVLPNGLAGSDLSLGGYAEADGLPVPTVYMSGSGGSYFESPAGSGVVFPDIQIYDADRTEWLGNLSFSAVAVPEPSAMGLLTGALVTACLRRGCRRAAGGKAPRIECHPDRARIFFNFPRNHSRALGHFNDRQTL